MTSGAGDRGARPTGGSDRVRHYEWGRGGQAACGAVDAATSGDPAAVVGCRRCEVLAAAERAQRRRDRRWAWLESWPGTLAGWAFCALALAAIWAFGLAGWVGTMAAIVVALWLLEGPPR